MRSDALGNMLGNFKATSSRRGHVSLGFEVGVRILLSQRKEVDTGGRHIQDVKPKLARPPTMPSMHFGNSSCFWQLRCGLSLSHPQQHDWSQPAIHRQAERETGLQCAQRTADSIPPLLKLPLDTTHLARQLGMIRGCRA